MLYSKRPLVASLGCALIGLVLHAPAAFASLSDDPPSLTVKYSPAQVASPRGSQDLYRRIDNAVREVCRASFSSSRPDLAASGNFKKCYTQTLAKAVADVNRPEITALHQNKATRIASLR